jgi:hypothetical protein
MSKRRRYRMLPKPRGSRRPRGRGWTPAGHQPIQYTPTLAPIAALFAAVLGRQK